MLATESALSAHSVALSAWIALAMLTAPTGKRASRARMPRVMTNRATSTSMRVKPPRCFIANSALEVLEAAGIAVLHEAIGIRANGKRRRMSSGYLRQRERRAGHGRDLHGLLIGGPGFEDHIRGRRNG